MVAECVETGDLPPISYQGQSFAKGAGSNFAEGTVSCPDGQVVLTGGADWNSTGDESKSVATARRTLVAVGWYGGGQQLFGRGHALRRGVLRRPSLPCRLAADRGFARGGLDYTTDLVTCPLGKRILNGGPSTLCVRLLPEQEHLDGRLGWWIAGHPGVLHRRRDADRDLIFASPGASGSRLCDYAVASFSLTGTDPAGFHNDFRCSLDGAPPTSCNFGAIYVTAWRHGTASASSRDERHRRRAHLRSPTFYHGRSTPWRPQ